MSQMIAAHHTQQNNAEDFTVMFNRFFVQLQAVFPAWRQAFPTTDLLNAAKRQWLEAMAENGIRTQEQINAGLRRARGSGMDFFPSPGKFVEWCKPTTEDFGLPSADVAYREAVSNAGRIGSRRWTHAAIHEAAIRVGMFDLGRMPDAEARKAFSAAYREVCALVMADKLQLALPAPDGDPVDKSAKESTSMIIEKKSPAVHLAEMRKTLGVRA